MGVNLHKIELLSTVVEEIKNSKIYKRTLNGVRLEIEACAEYSGVILDKKLNWNMSLEDRVRKATAAPCSCKKP